MCARDLSRWVSILAANLLVVIGDEGNITIGNNSNLQDGTVVRSAASPIGAPPVIGTTIGNDVTIGHSATLRACTIADASLIGMDATILEGAQVSHNTRVNILQNLLRSSASAAGLLCLNKCTCCGVVA